jgi:iron only hydrogenase large subunit-like protein
MAKFRFSFNGFCFKLFSFQVKKVFIHNYYTYFLSRIFAAKTGAGKSDLELPPVDFIAVSLQLQPLLSLAQKFQLTPQETAERLSGFLRSLGADRVFHTRAAEDVSLLEHAKEFVRRRRNQLGSSHEDAGGGKIKRQPLLSSSCPGWVCYAEKTHGSWILPYVSRVRSAQQIIGRYLKGHYATSAVDVHPSRLYHVALMPCFDKKLEASRPDFADGEVKDVDLVITTVEIENMLAERGLDLRAAPVAPMDDLLGGSEPQEPLSGNSGTGSGGYAEAVLAAAARELYSDDNPAIAFQQGRNVDLLEARYEPAALGSDDPPLRFAVANGFRNIQNLVQKMKRGRCEYDFVEVMACPGGCLNGGAQLKPPDGADPKEHVAKLDGLFRTLPVAPPETSLTAKRLYDEWLGGQESEKASHELYTEYHEVEKMTNSLAIKW